MPDKERLTMQVRTPFPCHHVEKIDDEIWSLSYFTQGPKTLGVFYYNATSCRHSRTVSEQEF